jgi:hydroxymethylbilane synthase
LARWQAEWVAGRLADRGVNVELLPITTQGDQQSRQPIASLGGEGVFTKEIQRALLDQRIDLAVHSLKDLPTEPVDGLCLAAVPTRAPAQDVLISRDRLSFDQLPPAAVIGTGSVRRRAQLWHVRPDLRMEDIRGNVDTRLRKLDERQFDAIILAEAGLRRLGMDERIVHTLPYSLMLPAVGQGALGLETRSDDAATRSAVAALDDAATHAAVTAERSLLAALRGGCLAPVAALAEAQDAQLVLTAVVLSLDGRQRLTATEQASLSTAAALGRSVAEQLLRQGAEKLIEAGRQK